MSLEQQATAVLNKESSLTFIDAINIVNDLEERYGDPTGHLFDALKEASSLKSFFDNFWDMEKYVINLYYDQDPNKSLGDDHGATHILRTQIIFLELLKILEENSPELVARLDIELILTALLFHDIWSLNKRHSIGNMVRRGKVQHPCTY